VILKFQAQRTKRGIYEAWDSINISDTVWVCFAAIGDRYGRVQGCMGKRGISGFEGVLGGVGIGGVEGGVKGLAREGGVVFEASAYV